MPSKTTAKIVPLQKLDELQRPSLWQRTRIFFKDSEVIFLARLHMLGGFFITAVGAMDWNPLVSIGTSSGLNKVQVIYLGCTVLTQGLFMEAARRFREPEMQKKAP